MERNKVIKFWILLPTSETETEITLQEGQSLTISHGGPTDEGYHSASETYQWDGKYLNRDNYSEGRDCDGKYSHHLERRRTPEGHWEVVTDENRDYSAEAAGY